MDKKTLVTIECFKACSHWKELAPCCGSCGYFFEEKGKEFCGYTFLRTRMRTTRNSFCGSYKKKLGTGGLSSGESY